MANLGEGRQPGPGQRNDLQRGVDAEFRHEALQMGADRVRGQLQALRDLFTAGPLNKMEQHVPLARGEGREQLVAVAAVILLLDQQAENPAQIRRAATRSHHGQRHG